MNDALLWNEVGDGAVECELCAHYCRISPGRRGICAVRVNDGGTLRTRVYGRTVTENADPIEKKPLHHFLPGSLTYSVAAMGCNFRCDFCQNRNISHVAARRDGGAGLKSMAVTPQEIVGAALTRNCESVSFTYTEPTVFFEYAFETAKNAKRAALKTVFVTNGYMTPECLDKIAPYLDACNVDLKSFSDAFYAETCGAKLWPVLESLKEIRARGIWLEVTTLIIPDRNDSEQELSDIAGFIAKELGRDVPWHVSKFHPQKRASQCVVTDNSSIEKALRIGRAAGLRYVYGGNVGFARDTHCPKCGALVIFRRGYRVDMRGLGADGCRKCGANIAGVFS